LSLSVYFYIQKVVKNLSFAKNEEEKLCFFAEARIPKGEFYVADG